MRGGPNGERERIRKDVQEADLGLPGINALFDRFAELQDRPRPALIHSDFNAGQVMVSDNAIAYVVDWDFAQHGRPMRDLGLCIAYTKFYHHSDERAAALRQAYQHIRWLSPEDTEECTLWEIYTLLRVTSAQHLAGGIENSVRGVRLIRDAIAHLGPESPNGTAQVQP